MYTLGLLVWDCRFINIKKPVCYTWRLFFRIYTCSEKQDYLSNLNLFTFGFKQCCKCVVRLLNWFKSQITQKITKLLWSLVFCATISMNNKQAVQICFKNMIYCISKYAAKICFRLYQVYNLRPATDIQLEFLSNLWLSAAKYGVR